MKLALSTAICEIVDTSIYSRVMLYTKKEYKAVVTALFQKEANIKIADAMKEAFHRRIECDNVQMHSPEYHNHGFESIHWEIELSEEEIQDIVSEYIIRQLGTARLTEFQMELSNALNEAIEENVKGVVINDH